MDVQGLRKHVLGQNRDGTVLRKAPSFPDPPARFHALGRNDSATGGTPGTCLPADCPALEAEDTENTGKRLRQSAFWRCMGRPYLHKRPDVQAERKEEARTLETAPADRRRNRLPGRSPAAVGKLGTCRDRRLNGCLPRPYRTWLHRLP